jgi:ABC-2 type transport system ATP-binding protein
VDWLIEGRGLRRSFGAVSAVDGVDLQVGAGEIVALLGPDGAGKTSLMRLLCGALRLDAGYVRLCGFDLRSQVEQARASLGYLPQHFSLYLELTVLENLRFFAEVRGVPGSEWQPRALEILNFVGLGEFAERRAGALSGGMRQKLGLAAALVHRPKVLLMDEPTGGVDPVTRQNFWQLLIRLLEEGVGVLISTPYMDEAARAQRVVFLNRGKTLAEGPPAILRRALAGRVLEVRASPSRMVSRIASADPSVEDVQAMGDRFHLRIAPGEAAAAEERLAGSLRAAGCAVETVRAVEPTLEDVYVHLLQSEPGADLARGQVNG